MVCQFPDYGRASHREGLDDIWRNPNRGHLIAEDLRAWQRGRTGYPLVDAGMRQLWQTGWMHNRARMVCASFLVKHLLIDWTFGERWFWDCLVDADYANNAVNWQWVAGTGVDSNMFPRIMAPLRQSEKFDAAGYIRRHVPELADLPDGQIHDPPDEARGAYPAKIIGHREAREVKGARRRRSADEPADVRSGGRRVVHEVGGAERRELEQPQPRAARRGSPPDEPRVVHPPRALG